MHFPRFNFIPNGTAFPKTGLVFTYKGVFKLPLGDNLHLLDNP